MALMKAASMNIIKGGGLEELFDGTKTRGKKEKPNAEEDRERAKSRQIHRSLEHCRFCYANKVQVSLILKPPSLRKCVIQYAGLASMFISLLRARNRWQKVTAFS